MRTGIALGSNLGNRLENIQATRDLLANLSTSPLRQAPIYITAPVNCPPGSPDFLNTVVEMSFNGSPAELLALTKSFQRQLGRTESKTRNAPRVIDIDILYFGDMILAEDDLVLPHPRLTQRRFVLQPLADIRPGLTLPGDDKSVSAHLRSLPDQEPLPVQTLIW